MPYLMNENQQTGKQLPYPGVRSGAAGTGAARASWMAHAAPARVGNFAGGGAVPGYVAGGYVSDPQWRNQILTKYQNEVISPAERSGVAPDQLMDFETGEMYDNPKAGTTWTPAVNVRPSSNQRQGAAIARAEGSDFG
jgi:hypothetical protein